jgi:hypothetical protein
MPSHKKRIIRYLICGIYKKMLNFQLFASPWKTRLISPILGENARLKSSRFLFFFDQIPFIASILSAIFYPLEKNLWLIKTLRKRRKTQFFIADFLKPILLMGWSILVF